MNMIWHDHISIHFNTGIMLWNLLYGILYNLTEYR